MKVNEIDLNLVFQQYFLMLINFGGDRVDKINLNLIKEKYFSNLFSSFLDYSDTYSFYLKKTN